MLNKMTKEELEVLSYADLAELILKESTKALNTPTIFKTICDLLEYSEDEYVDKIGEFYTALSTDKRFVFLDNEWELREKHPVDIVLEEDDEEEDENTEDSLDEEEMDVQEDDIDSVIEDDLDDVDDDLDDLSVLQDDELEEEL